MEFWAVKVEAGKALKLKPNEGEIIRISQISLDFKGEKGDTARLYVKFDGEKFCLGSLPEDKVTHLNVNLVFNDEFELSHSLVTGSVDFTGYTIPTPIIN